MSCSPLRNRRAVVDGHDPRAKLVVGRMERQREPNGFVHLVDEAAQAGQPPDGRDRGAPVRDADVRQAARSSDHVVDVQHRFAHAHEDGVVDRLHAPEVQRLVEDLPRGEVAPEPHLPRGAERARQGATGLGAEAQRPPSVAVAHEDGLDGMPVCGAEERLHGAVTRLALRLDGQRRKRHL